ncbi:hypothetical protein [Demequina subtropica]|uniref:hypothetical protein n=1 Tax=Demequina subtropica TaxID=1638989 RepID=UPI000781DE07|nr:hypothetical protein [Demequina subtropica]
MLTELRAASALSLIAAIAVAFSQIPALEGVAAALWLLSFACLAGAGALAYAVENQAPRHSSR